MIEWYEHHGTKVAVEDYLKGKHHDHCLCWICENFNPFDRSKNCPIANKLFDLCVEHHLVTPVYECPEFRITG